MATKISFDLVEPLGFNKSMWGKTPSELSKPIKEIANNFMLTFPESKPLYLYSEISGTGKTSLAMYIAEKAFYRKNAVKCFNCEDIINSFIANEFPDVSKLHLAILDGLGLEFRPSQTEDNNVATKALELFFKTLINNDVNFIVTGKVVPAKLKLRYSEQLASYLSKCEVVEFHNKDFRKL
jgi:hypothetical protein